MTPWLGKNFIHPQIALRLNRDILGVHSPNQKPKSSLLNPKEAGDNVSFWPNKMKQSTQIVA